MKSGGLAPAVLNASNEIAVGAFLNNQIKFTDIPVVVEHTLNLLPNAAASSLDVILEADQKARLLAQQFISSKGS